MTNMTKPRHSTVLNPHLTKKNTPILSFKSLPSNQILDTQQPIKSNIWNGAICSYMVYNVGSMAVQYLGRAQFLALYLLGGAFSQLCQVAGPILARNLPLPSVLEVWTFFE